MIDDQPIQPDVFTQRRIGARIQDISPPPPEHYTPCKKTYNRGRLPMARVKVYIGWQ